MRRSDRFFRGVWRFNALAIACAAVLFVLLGLYLATTIIYEGTRPRQVTNVVHVGDQEAVANEFSLGTPGGISGTSYVLVPLYRGQSYGSGSISFKRSDRNIVNYLFLDASTNEARWLFEGASQLILESHSVFTKMKASPDEARTAVGSFYVVVDRDTNGDKRLSERDTVSLATSAADGTGYKKLIEGIEQVYSIQQVADDKALVLYQKDQQTVSALFSLPSMSQLLQSSIPKLRSN